MNPEKKQKRILIIGTGGTIAGMGESGKTSSYQAGQIDVNKLISGVFNLNSLAEIEAQELLSIDSCDITFKDWIHISNYINQVAEEDKFDGFVITHGTDTMEETSYFLNLTVKTEKPVVLTGSMRPSTAMSPDGPFNIYQAVALARSDEAIGKGVLVAFSDGIYGARDVQKINSYKVMAFGHKELGCLGYIRDDKVYFYNESLRTHTVKSEFNIRNLNELPKVAVVPFYADADLSLLEHAVSISEGVVIAGAGCGGCNIVWNKKIKELIASGYPIVRSSRVSNGLVTCESPGSASESGIYADNLSPYKARILLSLALTVTKDCNEIRKMFVKY